MLRSLIPALAISALFAGAATAETFDIQMLNKNGNDRMVFEPAFVHAAVGDTVRFLPVDKGHNAETIDGMIPEGATAFGGKINEEFEITLDAEGVYGVMCKPHYAMGMVMTIAVGDVPAPDGFLEGRVPKKAKERFEAQLGNM